MWNRKGIWFCLLTPLLLSGAAGGYRAQIVGGTVASAPVKSNGRIDLADAEALVFRAGDKTFAITYARIGTLEYGQNVSRHYAAAILISPMFLLSKSRKHFVTVGFTDAVGAQQAVVFRVDKNDIRSVLISLEARSGRRVEYQDEDARKAVGR
jgi:hypothetical protein